MKTKAQPCPKYKPYPENHISMRVGIKVSWRTYAKRADAEKAAEAARWNAAIQSDLGYDFGYQSPGWIDEKADGFEVTLP